ncbi:MAG TPA: FMN-binding protein [Rectinemataceae bacterium]|nr:FMN-binding protein [Rectinemataceae bacterium]
MRKARLFGAALACLLASACVSSEVYAVRAMRIGHPVLSSLPDGRRPGTFSYGGFTYEVAVTISGGRMAAIDILKNRGTKPARMAEGVIPRILEAQSPDVDAVSGATTTSKALMKAVENALASPSDGKTP